MKLSLMGHETLLRAMEFFARSDVTTINTQKFNMCYLEVTPENVTKTHFVERFFAAASRSRSESRLFVLGDFENDIICARYADESYTFITAPSSLKRHRVDVRKGEHTAILKSFLSGVSEEVVQESA